MIFSAMLIDARHAALEDTEKPLDRVCRHVATNIFAFRMIDSLMFGEFLAGLLVMLRFIGMQSAVENDMVEQHFVDSFGVEVFHLEGFRAAATFYQGHNLALRRSPALILPALAVHEDGLRLADESFIDFNNFIFSPEWFSIGDKHRFTDAMRHEPSRAIRAEPKRPHKLVRRIAFLARRHQMKGERPFGHWDMARLHNGADHGRERLSTRIALIHSGTMRFAMNKRRLPNNAAMRTDRLAVGPANRLKMSAGFVFVVKDRIGKVRGHGNLLCHEQCTNFFVMSSA